MLMESLFVESCTDFQIGGTVYGHSCDVSDNSDDVSVVRNIRKKLSANVHLVVDVHTSILSVMLVIMVMSEIPVARISLVPVI